jgi:catechol 2,3-dioxygenase-like lactoylglutathione lyase family enzyme
MNMASSTQATTVDTPVVKVIEMDHIALRSRDVEASLRFYHGILGLHVERLEDWRAGKVPFPSVRLSPDTLVDIFQMPQGMADIPELRQLDHYCIVVEPTDLEQVKEQLEELGVEMAPANPFNPSEVGGPLTRWGAHGNGLSLYVYDPDRNIVELRYY